MARDNSLRELKRQLRSYGIPENAKIMIDAELEDAMAV
jgi:hypothetical protein